MKTRAYCKVNLSLDVLGLLDNGYHDLKMIMAPLSFYDELEIVKSETMEYYCEKKWIYFDEHNTVVKAINLMKDEFNIKDNFKVILKKHVPMKAGLAGGSSDGAAVIRIINKMYHLDLSRERIKELCLKIGSDVLFTYYSRPALVEGTGDKLTFIDIKDDYYVLIVKPRGGVSTKECYELVDKTEVIHPDTKEILKRLTSGQDCLELLANSLEKPAIELCADIKEAKEALINAGAKMAMVSGSGSTVFTVSKSYEEIEVLNNKLINSKFFVRKAEILKY